jgi:hypothetical protein
MSEITIKSTNKEIDSWIKSITFEREGETHLVTLYWHSEDGYDLVFENETNKTPEWAQTWIDKNDISDCLYTILDEMTEKEVA